MVDEPEEEVEVEEIRNAEEKYNRLVQKRNELNEEANFYRDEETDFTMNVRN